MPALDLVWNLIARDGASPAFARVGASAEGASRSVGGFMKAMAPLAGGVLIAEAIKSAADFQAKMALVQTQAGATANEVKKMSPAILSLAGRVAQAPEQLATSLYHVESTGLRGAKALEAVKIAAEGARVGHADLEQTTNALTATIASGMLPATETYMQAMGQLNTIVGSGDMKMEDLNEALSTGLLVTVKQFGVNINDVGAALADFGDNNIRGADAATKLRMAVQALAKPGKDADGALAKIGLTVEQIQDDLSHGGLNKALTDLHTHLVNSGIDASQWGQLMTDAFTKKAGAGIITLIGTFDRFEQKFEEVQGGANRFGKDWAATTKTAAFQFAQLKDTVDALGIRVGAALLPPLNSLAHLLVTIVTPLGSVVDFLGKLPQPVKDFALALGGLKLASMIGLLGGLQRAAAGVSAAFVEATAVERAAATQQAALWGESTAATEAAVAAQTSMWAELGASSSVAATEVQASVSRMAIAQGVATRAMGGMQAAGGRLVGFLGGPWGIAFAGAVAGFMLFQSAVQDARDKEDQWTEALKQGGQAAEQATASMAKYTALHQKISTGFTGFLGTIIGEKTALDDITPSAKGATKAFEDWYHSLHGTAKAQEDVTLAQNKLSEAIDKFGPNSKQAAAAATAYARAQDVAASKQKQFNDVAAKAKPNTDAASKALALYGDTAGMTKDQIAAAAKAIADEQKELQQDAQSFMGPLKSYQDMAQALAQKVADSTKSAKDSWSDYVSSVKVDLADYAKTLEKQITDQQNWQKNLVIIAGRAGVGVAQQLANMGVQGAGLVAQMATASTGDMKRLAKDFTTQATLAGSGGAQALQDGMAIMAADAAAGGKATVQAIATQLGLGLDTVRRIAAQYGIKLTEGLNPFLDAVGHPIIGTPTGNRIAAAFGQHWSGGYTGDGGKYEPKGVVHGGEFVFTKEQTAKAGVDTLYGLASMLSGFSGGGYVSPSDVPHPPGLTPPFHPPVSTAGSATMSREYDAARQILAAFGFAAGGGNTSIPGGRAAIAAQVQALAAMRGWGSGAEWQALVSVINRESGFNPNAANPTSSARGLFQKMTSIHGPVESTVTGQTNWGLNYIGSAYGDPLAAWRHEQQFGWYGKGTNYVPSDQLAFLHRGEAVVPASKNVQGAPYAAQPTTFNLYDVNGTLLGSMRGIAQQETDKAFDAAHDLIHYR